MALYCNTLKRYISVRSQIRRFLLFIFNVFRNVSFAIVVVCLLLFACINWFPRSTEAFVEELTGGDVPPFTVDAGEGADPEVETSGIVTSGNATIQESRPKAKFVKLGPKLSPLIFPPEEFVMAKKNRTRGGQHSTIVLNNGIEVSMRLSIKSIEEKLLKSGVTPFKVDGGVLNLDHVRRYRSADGIDYPSNKLIVTMRGVAPEDVFIIPQSRKDEFKDSLSRYFELE